MSSYKVDPYSPYLLCRGLRRWPVGEVGEGGGGGVGCRDVQANTHRSIAWADWSHGTCLSPGVSQPDLHLASGFCMREFVRLCRHSVLLRWLLEFLMAASVLAERLRCNIAASPQERWPFLSRQSLVFPFLAQLNFLWNRLWGTIRQYFKDLTDRRNWLY